MKTSLFRALSGPSLEEKGTFTGWRLYWGLLDSDFRFWLSLACLCIFACLCVFACLVLLPCLLACPPVSIPCRSHSGDFAKDSDSGSLLWLFACFVFACLAYLPCFITRFTFTCSIAYLFFTYLPAGLLLFYFLT